ncbi:MAG TPA: hypothetical protein H9875_07545 [Candidatus Levilactobacillus faecigallinarum]|uniref:Uncharacterized protein n=1 Tax=Candidatus Levilactobacillus faecigallinarum TaxID=2838638 RepID=A0A9D1U574_9LACO|nr:hypothetical protein [Candidatus Levilactobacillus faecigallinarum]
MKADIASSADLVPYLAKSGLKGNQDLARQIQQTGWTQQNVTQRQNDFAASTTLVW